ncbi:MAG: hypothetical protein GY862_18175 [Gammaproteobacteria bacterium]|nr:hypothetical protein [Gammaproteobacteria bacterium]
MKKFPMRFFCNFSLLVFLALAMPQAESRPEIIHAGVSYYSNEYSQKGFVRDIESEKNYEEIYQFYTYYEVIYDAAGRVNVFKEYKRGEVIREERYLYNSEGQALERTVLIPDKPAEVTRAKGSQ